MIKIRTTLPKQPVTPEVRLSVARQLGKFLPNPAKMPFAASDIHGCYTMDDHNDWWCCLDDEDNQLVAISYRDTGINPHKELAFAEWVCVNRQGWVIVHPPLHAADPDVGTAAVVDVTLDVQFAYEVDEWELGTITFEIPIERVGVFLDGKLVPNARVTGYTTTDNIEITSCQSNSDT